jgi:hypothetical protein
MKVSAVELLFAIRSSPFQISEDIFNNYLLNMSMSATQAYGHWNTSVNATKDITVNAYSFSAPLNLILPYFITLLLAMPFIILGGLALYWNGISPMDGGCMQIITTSTSSAVLDRAAAGGCLGGNENVPQELKDLKIRFGEFIRHDNAPVKKAGFGAESETTTLKKGANYGIARWIWNRHLTRVALNPLHQLTETTKKTAITKSKAGMDSCGSYL